MNPYVFFHRDLDGIVSYMALCWAYDAKLPYCAVPNVKQLSGLIKANLSGICSHYGPVYIADLDTREVEEELKNYDNIFIFDHHSTNTSKLPGYVDDKVSSCSKLIYKWARENRELELTPERKLLIALADDYDSWAHKFPESSWLSAVYHGTANKVESFIEAFWDGFKGFTSHQAAIINDYERGLTEAKQSLAYHYATFSIQGKQRKLAAIFCENFVNECLDEAVKKSGAEVVFGIHPKAGRVFIRKAKGSDVNLGKVAATLLAGGGHEDAAGGIITEPFLEFTKLFE